MQPGSAPNNFPSAVPPPNTPPGSGGDAPKLREPLLGVAVGRKFVGKTYTTNQIIFKYVYGLLSSHAHARKVLVLDINDEFRHLKAIALKDIPQFSASYIIEPRRVRIYKENGSKMSLNEIIAALNLILNHFKDGLLLIEDINKYISDSLPNDLIGAICTQRHVGCDIILHFQSIGRITPKIWQNCNWIRFHKNNDSCEVHKEKFPDKEEPLKIVEAMVNTEVDKQIKLKGQEDGQRFYVYFDCEEEKIKGAYSQRMLWDAIIVYLEKNYKKTIQPLLQGVDLTTGKTRTGNAYQTAQQVATEMFRKYYGNGALLPM